jgi:hypothetical protein
VFSARIIAGIVTTAIAGGVALVLVTHGKSAVVVSDLQHAKTIAIRAQRSQSELLSNAAVTAFGAGDIETSGYLLCCVRVRATLELAMFPPKEKGGNNAALPTMASHGLLASVIMPALLSDPEALARVRNRIAVYEPQIGFFERPYWSSEGRGDPQKAMEAMTRERDALVANLDAGIILTKRAGYLAAVRTFAELMAHPSEERFPEWKSALETLRAIEEETGLKTGLFPERRTSDLPPDFGRLPAHRPE